jgi:hypothetical protein
MQSALSLTAFATMVAVALVLFAGLSVMLRGKSPSLSQNLMRWRVGLQFVAVVLLVVYAYVAHM